MQAAAHGHNAAAHTAHGSAVRQHQHLCAHLPGGRTVAGNDGRKDRSLPLSRAGIQRIQQSGREAFRLLTAIFHLNDLREDGQCDFLRCLRLDGEADGGVE